MNSLILNTAARLMVPVLVIFSLLVLWRGHNDPGGGFIGGLLAATSLALYEKAAGLERTERMLRIPPLAISAVGLACALASAVWGAIAKGYVLAGVWPLLTVGPGGEKEGLPVGSILLFDLGVFLVVVGGVSAMLFALEEAAVPAHQDEQDDIEGKD